MSHDTTCVLGLAVFLLAPVAVTGQDTPQAKAWPNFARSMAVGSELNMRLRNGQRFRAVLVQAGIDAMLLQPRTRIPGPVQRVAYDAVSGTGAPGGRRRQSGPERQRRSAPAAGPPLCSRGC